ncbi:hypothetical protein [Sorangium sp. So ce1000]|uniref:hypothetical protein n=1 Tax=Sorangium sp. So ce1000 TaxID=3133325 RepID=UPI003F5EF8A0
MHQANGAREAGVSPPAQSSAPARLPTSSHDVYGYFRTLVNASGQMGLPGDSGGARFLGGSLAGISSAWYFDLSGGIQVSIPDVRDWMANAMIKSVKLSSATFSDTNGRDDGAEHYETIAYPDINGDEKAERLEEVIVTALVQRCRSIATTLRFPHPFCRFARIPPPLAIRSDTDTAGRVWLLAASDRRGQGRRQS